MKIIAGTRRESNQRILELAAQSPCLIIDCANVADPHQIVRIAKPEILDDISVIEVDLLYKFRDVLLQLPRLTGEKRVLITTFDRLFNYQDEQENKDVYDQIWLLLRRRSVEYDLTIAVKEARWAIPS